MGTTNRRQFGKICLGVTGGVLLLPAMSSLEVAQASVMVPAARLRRQPGKHVPATTFQTGSAYAPSLDLRTEGVMVYITNAAEDVETKIAGWGNRGYVVEVMTSASHDPGDYWASGKADGQVHWDAIQELATGEKFSFAGLFHYVTPTQDWINYHVGLAERIIAAGASAIYYEEPEFWNHTGYEGAFRLEWSKYYGEPWEDPTSSDRARWRSEQLKSHLYTRFMAEVSARIKSRHPDTRVMVAAHSNPDYNALGISYAGAAVAAIGTLDGYVGQAWSNTASLPIPVEGVDEVHVFEESLLEYSYFSHLARLHPGMPFLSLADPFADFGDPTQWDAYRRSYQQTIVAQLLQEKLDKYEVVPWPERVFTAGTPSAYRSSLLTVFAAQREISENGWSASLTSPTQGVGLLTADSLTWQHGIGDQFFRPATESFYGLGYPLVADGIPVNVVPADSLGEGHDDRLAGLTTLLCSFEYWKPSSRAVVDAIAQWVRRDRGTLILFEGQAIFRDIDEWWSAGGFASPEDALIDALGIGLGSGAQLDVGQADVLEPTANGKRLAALVGRVAVSKETPIRSRSVVGTERDRQQSQARELFTHGDQPVVTEFTVGRGSVVWVGLSPTYAARIKDGGRLVRGLTQFAQKEAGRRYDSSGSFIGRRGPYVGVGTMRGTSRFPGTFVNVFDERLEITKNPQVEAGSAALLYDVAGAAGGHVPRLVLSGGRISEKDETTQHTRYLIEGPAGTYTTARLLGNRLSPSSVRALDQTGQPVDARWEWSNSTGSMLLRHDSRSEGVIIEVTWSQTRIPDTSEPITAAGITFSAGTDSEKPYLLGQVSPGGLAGDFRYADATGSFTYLLTPGAVNNGTLAMTLVNNYVVELSADGLEWHKVLKAEEIYGRDVKDGSNRATQLVRPAAYSASSGDLYVRISDGSVADGWGGGLYGLSLVWLQGGNPTTI